jgi:hypothetical protein
MYKVLCISSTECEVFNHQGLIHYCWNLPNSLTTGRAVQHVFYVRVAYTILLFYTTESLNGAPGLPPDYCKEALGAAFNAFDSK